MVRVLNTPEEPFLPEEWVTCKEFKSHGNLYRDRSGKEYKITYKHQHVYSGGARFLRGIAGCALAIATVGIALAFKDVRNLLTRKKESIYYAVPIGEIRKHVQDEEIPLTTRLEYLQRYLAYFKLEDPDTLKSIITQSVETGGPAALNLHLISQTKEKVEYTDDTLIKAVDAFIREQQVARKNIEAPFLQPFASVIENRLTQYGNYGVKVALALLPSVKAAEFLVLHHDQISQEKFLESGLICMKHANQCTKDALSAFAKECLKIPDSHTLAKNSPVTEYTLTYVRSHPEQFSADDKLRALCLMNAADTRLFSALFDEKADNLLRHKAISTVYKHLSPAEKEQVDQLLLPELKKFNLDAIATCEAIGAFASKKLSKAAQDIVLELVKYGSRHLTAGHFEHIIAPFFEELTAHDQQYVIWFFGGNHLCPALSLIVLKEPAKYDSKLFDKCMRFMLDAKGKIPQNAIEHVLDTTRTRDRELVKSCILYLFKYVPPTTTTPSTLHAKAINHAFDTYKDPELIQIAAKNIFRYGEPFYNRAMVDKAVNTIISHPDYLKDHRRHENLDNELISYLVANAKDFDAVFEGYKPHIYKKPHHTYMSEFELLFEKVLQSSNSLDTICSIACLKHENFKLDIYAAKRLLHLLQARTVLKDSDKITVYKLANLIFDNKDLFTPSELEKAASLFLERDDIDDKLEVEAILVIKKALEKVVSYIDLFGTKIKLSERAEIRYKAVSQSITRSRTKAKVRVATADH